MAFVVQKIITALTLLLISMASSKFGAFFKRFHLPLISGYLVAGVIAGPYVLGILSKNDVESLAWVSQLSLAFIAFAAGGELSLKQLRPKLKNIRRMTLCLVFFTFSLGAVSVYYISGIIPFMQDMPKYSRLAVSILAGAILVARSPSSAVAIIKELRARGPFTQAALGVTVIMDVVVISLFALNSSIADAILTEIPFDLWFLILLAGEFSAAFGIGYILSMLLKVLFRLRFSQGFKFSGLLILGYGVFYGSAYLRYYTHEMWGIEVLIEPLLVCMLAGFLMTNTGNLKNEFNEAIHTLNPYIFLVFFSLVGASIQIDTLGGIWLAALILFFVRLAGIFIGAFTGSLLSGESVRRGRISWMAYVTQAGVGLGLAQEVAVEFPGWGAQFATMMVAVIILNQFIGPLLFKRVLFMVHEARPPAKKSDPDQIPLAVIFGSNAQAMALARQLIAHEWQVRMVARVHKFPEDSSVPEKNFYQLKGTSRHDLKSYHLEEAGATVMIMGDEKNYATCHAVSEHFPVLHQVVLIDDLSKAPVFQKLGVDIVNSSTATISLLDHYVRSPSVVSLLMEQESEDYDLAELVVKNETLSGKTIKELNLCEDVLFLGIRKKNILKVAKGKTKLALGDKITVAGSPQSLSRLAERLS
ncbi:MAG: cation:proton antiporter [Fibrobacteria bacterium]|nr:cation:proton antiporter [Fibrobacteria bacterium]